MQPIRMTERLLWLVEHFLVKRQKLREENFDAITEHITCVLQLGALFLRLVHLGECEPTPSVKGHEDILRILALTVIHARFARLARWHGRVILSHSSTGGGDPSFARWLDHRHHSATAASRRPPAVSGRVPGVDRPAGLRLRRRMPHRLAGAFVDDRHRSPPTPRFHSVRHHADFATWMAGVTTGSRVARCNAHAAALSRSVLPPATRVIAPAPPTVTRHANACRSKSGDPSCAA